MHLTQHTNYALRVLMYLATVDRAVRIAEIAEAHAISHNHLVKVVHRLAKEGYVHTKQGRNGGMSLAKPAASITVGEIVRLTEDHMNLVECFQGGVSACKILPVCILQRTLVQALAAFMKELDGTTIADVTRNRVELLQSLGMRD